LQRNPVAIAKSLNVVKVKVRIVKQSSYKISSNSMVSGIMKKEISPIKSH
jgi:hypothetical protein